MSSETGRQSGRQATLLERIAEKGERVTVATGSTGESPELDTATLARLTECERRVYVAVEWNGYAPREFAAATDRAPSTARTLLQRAREKMGVEA